jgi:hypothetical protein
MPDLCFARDQAKGWSTEETALMEGIWGSGGTGNCANVCILSLWDSLRSCVLAISETNCEYASGNFHRKYLT